MGFTVSDLTRATLCWATKSEQRAGRTIGYRATRQQTAKTRRGVEAWLILIHDRGSVETSMAEQYTLSEDTIEYAEGALCHAIEESVRTVCFRNRLSQSVGK